MEKKYCSKQKLKFAASTVLSASMVVSTLPTQAIAQAVNTSEATTSSGEHSVSEQQNKFIPAQIRPEAQKNLNQATAAAANAHKEVQAEQQKNNAAKAELQKAIAHQAELKKQKEEAESRAQQAFTRLTSQATDYFNKAEAELAKAKSEATLAAEAAAKAQEAYEQAQKEVQAAQVAYDEAAKHVNMDAFKEAESKLNKAKETLKSAQAQKDAVQKEVGEKEKALAAAQKEAQDSAEALAKAQSQLTEAKQRKQHAQDALSQAKDKFDEATKDGVKVWEGEISKADAEIEKLNKQIENLKQDSQAKSTEIAKQKELLSKNQQELADVTAHLAEVNSKLDQLNKELADIQTADKDKQQKLDALTQEIKNLEEKKQACEAAGKDAAAKQAKYESQLAAKEAVLNGTSIKEANDKLYDDFINKTFISNDGSYVKAEAKEHAWYKALNDKIEKSGIDRKELGMYGFMGWLLENEYFDGMDKDFIMAHYMDNSFMSNSSGYAAPYYAELLTTKYDKGQAKLGDSQSATDAVNMMATFNEYAAYQKAMQNIIDQLKAEGVEAANNYTLKKFYIDPNAFMTTAITADLCTWGGYSHDGNAVAGYAECIAADAQFNGIRGITQWLQEYQYFQKAVDAGVCKWSDFFKEDGFHIPRAAAQYFKDNNIQFVNYGHAQILTNALLQAKPSKEPGFDCYGAFGHGIMANIFQTASGAKKNGYYETKFVEKDGTLIRSIYDNIYGDPTGNLVGQGKEYEVDTLKNLFMRFLKEKGVLTDELADTYKSDVVDQSAIRFDNLWTRMQLDINRATGNDSYEKNPYDDCKQFYVNTEAIQDEVKTLKEQIVSAKQKAAQSKLCVQNSTEAIKNKQQEAKDIADSMGIDGVLKKIDEAQRQKSELERQQQDKQTAIDSATGKIAELNQGIDTNDQAIAQAENTKKSVLAAKAKHDLDEAQKNVDDASLQVKNLENAVQSAQHAKDLAEKKVTDAQRALTEAQDALAQAQAVVADAQDKKDAAQKPYDEILNAHEAFKEANKNLTAAQNQEADAQAKLAALQNEVTEKNASVDAANKAVAAAKLALDEARAITKSYNGADTPRVNDPKFAYLNDLIAELKQKIADLSQAADVLAAKQKAQDLTQAAYDAAYKHYQDLLKDVARAQVDLDKFNFRVVKGAQQKVKPHASAAFVVDGFLSPLAYLEIDGVKLAPENYTVSADGAAFELSEAYLATLPQGKTYTVLAVYDNGGIVKTSFTMVKPVVPAHMKHHKKASQKATPQTSDIASWLPFGLAAFGLSFVGLAAKKKGRHYR